MNFSLTKEAWINRYVWVTEFFLLSLMFPISFLFFDIHIHGRENFSKVQKPFIIVSNHIAFYDSFLFRVILGFWTNNLPLRFMAVSKFEKKFLQYLSGVGIVHFIYFLFGAFIIKPGEGIEKNLEHAKIILKARGNIVMYPEGRITSGNMLGTFKKGAAVLMRETQVPVIPVSLRFGVKHFFRQELFVEIGEPIFQSTLSAEELTAVFYKKIREQYEKR